MSQTTSVLSALLASLPHLRAQIYFKSSLTALSHAMEDRVLASSTPFMVIASFQRERYYRQEAYRYRRIAKVTPHVYVLAAPETEFRAGSGDYETIAFPPDDPLAREWHLVVLGASDAACLICRECDSEPVAAPDVEAARRFEGVWTFDRDVCTIAANILIDRAIAFRPELADPLAETRSRYVQSGAIGAPDPQPFVERLVTHLQAGQYRLVKAYRSLAEKERMERLQRSIATIVRRSLDPAEVLQAAVEQLGSTLNACRCIVYRCRAEDDSATVAHEYLDSDLPSLAGERLPLQSHPLLQAAIEARDARYSDDLAADLDATATGEWLERASISAWIVVPMFYKDRLLGAIELHRCTPTRPSWQTNDVRLVEAIANQVSIALAQAEAYAHLGELNEQLAALDRTRSNLVAITGHELRTPLSTVQVCLESLAAEPDMSGELRQVMLNTALNDAARMRDLIQDFLTLSRLESGRVEWNPEPVAIDECADLAISNARARARQKNNSLPAIHTAIAVDLPPVSADGEWFVEVLAKLLDNACKFTDPDGTISLAAEQSSDGSVSVTVADTGRGIEPAFLETVFDRFYQEEGALQRTTGGTGLGLAICRQIVNKWGGQIWAESAGRDRGTQVHFTVPVCTSSVDSPLSSLPAQRSQRRSLS
ncbi:putative sensor protein [Rubidibacter lacunae KORDI 51-2]|uniref:histidine kinase n=1 Tax=Rubidibacter lacunae KORDI 51-2 TaxID=582515 RepID=U5DMG1_9CHRO|nr:DICT sensory domain-containing protein [Rubidibacter lacunae]ERN40895.1 putative sensor protein [Rubidibacter lacunae KORDI 51-2]